MARTDALAVEGLDAAIERACACVEAGADMIFPEAITDLAMYQRVRRRGEGAGPRQHHRVRLDAALHASTSCASAGVAIALYPLSAFRAMNKAALDVYATLRRDGTQKAVVDTMQTRAELYDYLGYHAYEQQARRAVRGQEVSDASVTCMSDDRMTDAPAAPKPKKSVALSGVAAGNTALCTVGRTGNDLHYRGYDILDLADDVRVRGDRPPAGARQAAERRRARRLQDEAAVAARPAGRRVQDALERVPAGAHPMDVHAHRRARRSAACCRRRTTTARRARATSPTG